MKRTNLLAKAGLLFAASATLLFASCDNGNDDDGGDNGSKKLQLTVNLTAPTGYEASQLPAMTVTAVNSDKELTYTETTIRRPSLSPAPLRPTCSTTRALR